jgi:hypothetical protein
LGNACYHSVQSLLSSRLLSRKVKVKIYKTRILPFVLDGCETWSLILRDEHRLRVFENRVLRRIFEPKRDEVTGEWRTLHSEDLHNLYSFPRYYWADQIKFNEVGGACGTHGRWERRGKFAGFRWETPKERDHSEDQDRRRWEDGIRMGSRKIGWGCRVDPVGSGQGPVAGSCKYGDKLAAFGAWGERRHSSCSFLNSALEGVSGQRHAPSAL